MGSTEDLSSSKVAQRILRYSKKSVQVRSILTLLLTLTRPEEASTVQAQISHRLGCKGFELWPKASDLWPTASVNGVEVC